MLKSCLNNYTETSWNRHRFMLRFISFAEAIIGFLNTSTSTPEEAIVLCVSLLNGTLQEGLTIYYTISTTNITADGQ